MQFQKALLNNRFVNGSTEDFMAQETNTELTQTESKKGPFFGYRVVLALALAAFCPISFALSCVGIFYPTMSAKLGVDTGMLSYYTSMLWIGVFVSLPVSGRLFSKLSARTCVMIYTAIMTADLVCLSMVNALWQYYACGFVSGWGIGMLLFIAPGTLINRWFAKRAGFWIGIVMAFTGIGGVIWSTVGGALIASIGASGTYLVFAVFDAVTIPIAFFCIASFPRDKGVLPYGFDPTAAEHSADGKLVTQSGMPAEKAYKTPVFIWLCALVFMLNIVMYVYFIIPSYIRTLPIGVAMPLLGATASSAAMAGQTIIKVVLGAIGEKRTGIVTTATAILGIVGIVLLMFGGGAAVLLYIAAFTFGCLYGTANVMLPIFTRNAFGTADYSRIYSRISMAASFGSVVTGFLWGTTITVTGGYTVCFVGNIAVAVIIIVCALAAAKATKAMKERGEA